MTAVFTITVDDDRTSVHTQGAPGCIPVRALDAAIDALKAERENVHKCPAQRVRDRDAAPRGREAAEAEGQQPGPEGDRHD